MGIAFNLFSVQGWCCQHENVEELFE